MKQEIKERIELINKGIVPAGYKKTPVWICPVKWEETTLKNIFIFKNGLNKEKSAFGKGTPIINYTDVWGKRGLKLKDVKGKVTLNKNEIENYSAKKGDVFFTRTSETINEIGLTSVLLEDIKDCVFSGFVLRGRPISNLIVNEYNQYCYSLDFMRNEITKKSSYTTRALTNGELLSQVLINLPTKSEQQKIAEILDCATRQVELQEQLVYKLKLQKKALMQKLLTPQTDWQEVKLGDICKITTGKMDANDMVEDGDYPFFTCSKDIYKIDKYAYDMEALLMAGNGEIGDIKYYNGKFNAYQRTYILYNFKLNIKYVMQYLLLHFNKAVCKGAQKSSMPYIRVDLLNNAQILFPKNLDIIAKTLNCFDKQIELQQKLLEQYKLRQKSLMQLLLTGIVRVG